jgi:hypothetical protein
MQDFKLTKAPINPKRLRVVQVIKFQQVIKVQKVIKFQQVVLLETCRPE